MEIWKDIEGFEGIYQVSNEGRVRSLDHYASNGNGIRLFKGKIIKQTVGTNNYMGVRLSKAGKVYPKEIHRLVALHFVENTNNLPCVNHKDENRENNKAENLEWCTYKYNNNYGGHGERLSKSHIEHLDNNKRCKKVAQINESGEIIAVYPSLRDAARKNGCKSHSTLKPALKDENKKAKGYFWRYV